MRRTIFRAVITGSMAVVFMASQATMVAYASDIMMDSPYTQNEPETGNGGAIYQTGPVINDDYTNNHPESNGGAIYYEGSVSGKEFVDNNPESDGGAIYYEGSVLRTEFEDNNPGSNGGAIYPVEPIVDSEYLNNTVTYPNAISFVE